MDKRKNSNELIVANKELVFQNKEIVKKTYELTSSINKLLETETKLNKMNRLYSFISHINKTITHVRDEKKLFKDACRIAHEQGEFKIAWIGRADIRKKEINLLEQYGIDDSNLSRFANTPYEKDGPQDYVLKKGITYVCNDVDKDLKVIKWREFALINDIRSCAVLPLIKSGIIIGTFNLYSTELNFFDKKEIQMLEEVAADIEFGLELIEKQELQKKTEKQIIQSEKLFRALIENSSDIKILSTKGGNMLYVSPSITKVLGYTLDEFLAMHRDNLIHPDDIEYYLEKRRAITKTPRASFQFQLRLHHKNGDWIWCEGTIINMLNEPAVRALVSNFNDISKQKLAENQREFDSNNLDALINNTSDLMWSVDKDFNLITSNKPFDEIGKISFGKTIEKGENVLSVAYTPEMLNHFKKLYERAFAGEDFTESEYFNFPTEVWTEISYSPILRGLEVIGTACHSHDITNIKKAEKQLQERKVFIMGILNSLNSHIAVIDDSGNIVAINESWKQFALDNGETTLHRTGVGSNYFKVCKKSTEAGDKIATEALKGIKEVMEERVKTFYLEYPCHSPDVQRWFGMRAVKFESEVPMVVISHLDITERKLAEERLLKSEARLKEAQAIAHIGNWEIDMVNNIHIWSDEFYEIFGINKNDIQPSAKAFLSFIHPEDAGNAQKKVEETFETLKDSSVNFRFILKNGTIKYGYSKWRFEFDKENNPTRLYGILQDVTEQKKAEILITESEARLAEAQAVAKVGSWKTDLSTYEVLWSSETFRIFGLNPDNFHKSHPAFLEYVHPEDKVKVDEAFVASLDKDSINSIEHRIVTPSGEIKTVEERWKIFRNSFGVPNWAVGTCQDITERKNTEKEREKMITDIIQRNRDLEQFTFIISHNLRAPTANIIGLTECLQSGTLTPLEQKEFLQGLSVSVSNLDAVIKDINEILKVKQETGDKKETIFFDELLTNVVMSIRNLVEKYRAKIKSDFTQADEIFSQRVYMYSIFYNLISNSIKYQRPNVQPIIEINSTKQNGMIILKFKDNGLGIDLKSKGDKIFGLYNRFHSHVEGKGMGLFMVKTQVEAMGGKISVASQLNKGTEFTIEFYN
jgi:PAS domain S-box-containing protein